MKAELLKKARRQVWLCKRNYRYYVIVNNKSVFVINDYPLAYKHYIHCVIQKAKGMIKVKYKQRIK